MKQNNWVTCNTPIDVYRVSSKGIRHIRTIIPGKRREDDPKPDANDPKPRRTDDKPDKPE